MLKSLCGIGNIKYRRNQKETEKIEVTKRGVVIFTMVPKKYELGERLKDYFGILPADATIGKDPDERD